MATTVTLAYDVDPGPIPPATFAAQVLSIVLDQGEQSFLGLTPNSDTVAVVGALVRRTVVLNVGAQANLNFPSSDALKAATRNLYTERLSMMLPSVVTAIDPVVA